MSQFKTKLLLAIALGTLSVGPFSTDVATAQDFEIICVVRELDEVEIPARRDGVLQELKVRRGYLVDKKELIALQDHLDTKLKLNVAQAQLSQAIAKSKNAGEIQLAQAKVALAAQEQKLIQELGNEAMFLERFRMQNSLEQANAQLKTAISVEQQDKLDVEVKRGEAKVLENDIAQTKLFSPVQGVVQETKKDEGEWVSTGETILVVTRMDTLLAEGFLDSKKTPINSVINATATVTFEIGGKRKKHTIEGLVVKHAAPKLELDGKFPVWVEFKNRLMTTSDGKKNWLLRPGMRAKLHLHLETSSTSAVARK